VNGKEISQLVSQNRFFMIYIKIIAKELISTRNS